MKIIIVSAVNLVEGGTLTILRDCLQYLSLLASDKSYRVIAIVHSKENAYFQNIEYIETKWPKKRWANRIWFEYFTMNNISKEIGEVYLWFSLHDTTPNVKAVNRAVYCHNPFPFYKWKWREFLLTPKIVMFSLFSKYAYEINIKKNRYVIVQQDWIREKFTKMFNLEKSNIIIALPTTKLTDNLPISQSNDDVYRFIYAASPNTHKNFECLTEAAAILSSKCLNRFEVYITIDGTENEYAKWIKSKWGHIDQIKFIGFMDQTTLFQKYADVDSLIFPSKIETWGLPITEFASFEKPMLLADLEYAYETAAGKNYIAFFNPNNPKKLADLMQNLINGNSDFLTTVPDISIQSPVVSTWRDLFKLLLS